MAPIGSSLLKGLFIAVCAEGFKILINRVPKSPDWSTPQIANNQFDKERSYYSELE